MGDCRTEPLRPQFDRRLRLEFHGANVTQGATLSILTTETIEDIKLFPAAYPEKYGDSVGAALDLQTRDGSRTTPTFRATIGGTQVTITIPVRT